MDVLLSHVAVLGALLFGAPLGYLDRPSASGTIAMADARHPHAAPERPRVTVEIPEVATPGRTIAVAATGDLQAAIDEAKPGDRITLEPGATYRGPFLLKRKAGDRWIVITTTAKDLPARGRRVNPSHAPMMPKLVAESGSVLQAEPGAHHYRLVGLEVTAADGVHLNTLVELGSDESSVEVLPHHLIVDRCYLHGDRAKGARRGVAMNSRHTAVVDSHLSDFKVEREDSQAIAGWNGDGPFRIANNYLEAAGENVMFGGADPEIEGLVPSDIEVVRNHMAKPLAWMKAHKSFEGTEWAVKNLFELKNARRVLIDGNLFEYNWPHAQNGFAILFTVRNQDGGAPWSTIEDVTFANNLVRHVAAGINVLGRDDNHPSQQVRRIAIRNNLFQDVGGQWGNGRLFQLLEGTAGVTIDHNTAFQTGSILFGGDKTPHTGFVFQNNVVPHNEHGITGSGTNAGSASLARYFPGAIVRRNVLVGARSGQYPADNFFPASLGEVWPGAGREKGARASLARQFVRAGTEGRDPGADITVIARALDGIATIDALGDTQAETGITGPIVRAESSWWPPSWWRVIAAWWSTTSKHSQMWLPPSGGSPSWGPASAGSHRPDSAASWIFWAAFALLFYVYAGYALVAGLRAKFFARPVRRGHAEPTISIVVVAYNEAERIAARIENLLALDYPRDRVQIVVGSDGSSDDTVAIARGYESSGVRVRAFDERRGKAAVINRLVRLVRGEIVVFADARQRFDPGVLRALVANFADPEVGGVSGELVLTPTGETPPAGQGTAFYWRVEKFIRWAEAQADSTVGATGAIYAIRRELFEPIPDDTLLDDVLIPLRIAGRGYRVLFEPAAVAYDRAPGSARQEFARKARTIAGNFQLFTREGWLLSPWHNRLWFETLSHKALRLTLPLLHATLLAANVALMDSWFFRLVLALQVAFYVAATVGYAQGESRRRSIGFSVPCAICLMVWATVVGFVRFATNRQQITWDRAASPSSAAELGVVLHD